MKKRSHFLLVFLFMCCYSFGQDSSRVSTKDTSRFVKWLKGSTHEIGLRTVFMSTTNRDELKDDYAWGVSAGFFFETKPLYGFRFGISDHAIQHLVSSPLNEPDPTTKNINRYELGLFDVAHPTKTTINRIERLYLSYTYSKTSVTAGRLALNTPFINPQDGRLRPTAQQGVWFTMNEFKKVNLSGGWITHLSPRSSAKWYSAEETIGLYPSGVNVDGKPSIYKNNLRTAGIGLLSIQYKPSEKFKLTVWNAFIENILNTSMFEINHEIKFSKKGKSFYQGLMVIHQDAIHDGGNADPAKTYIRKGATSNVISLQAGVRSAHFNSSVNYTRITSDGQYMMPREWGRDPFYTFLPRERNEGMGDVHAWMANTKYTRKQMKASFAVGYYKLPDVKNYRLNKYGFPSYWQMNGELQYLGKKKLKNLSLRALAVYKLNAGETYNNLKFVYNKVDLFHFNLIVDYKL